MPMEFVMCTKQKILHKMALAFVESWRAFYKELPFGAKQEETYYNDFFLRIKTKKNSYKRHRLAEEVLKYRKLIGEKNGN